MVQVREQLDVPSPETTGAGATRAAVSAPRLGWLDALRGIAVLAVVFQHAGPQLVDPLYHRIHLRLDPGIFGVFLFFLVSGYIVPASLERRGSVREFWVGRIFRIYPLYVAVFLAAALLLPRSHSGVDASVFRQPWLSAAANGLMLQDLLGVTNGLKVAWTLSYEMVFYYLVSALFTFGWHRRSAPIAVGFATVALLAGGALPLATLTGSGTSAVERTVVAALLVVVLAMTGILSGRPMLSRAGVLLLAALALALVFLNSRSAAFETMMILATMFAGTAIHRAEHGQIGRRSAVLSCGFVFAAGTAAGVLYAGGAIGRIWTLNAAAWYTAFAAAWLVFGAGFLLRKRRIPHLLSRLGAVSYAVYLVHFPLLVALEWAMSAGHCSPHGTVQGLCWLAAFTAAVLAVSEGAHRMVELPGQRLGRRLLGRSNGSAGKANLAGQSG